MCVCDQFKSKCIKLISLSDMIFTVYIYIQDYTRILTDLYRSENTTVIRHRSTSEVHDRHLQAAPAPAPGFVPRSGHGGQREAVFVGSWNEAGETPDTGQAPHGSTWLSVMGFDG